MSAPEIVSAKEFVGHLPRLRQLRMDGDVEALIAELSNPLETPGGADAASVRAAAASELGYIAGEEAVEPIVELLSDRLWLARLQAAQALGQIGSRTATPALLDALRERDKIMQDAIIASLGLIGDPRAVPEIRRFLTETTATFVYGRGAALAALLMVDDPEARRFAEEELRKEPWWRRRGVRRTVAHRQRAIARREERLEASRSAPSSARVGQDQGDGARD
jgi:hypothetical protein